MYFVEWLQTFVFHCCSVFWWFFSLQPSFLVVNFLIFQFHFKSSLVFSNIRVFTLQRNKLKCLIFRIAIFESDSVFHAIPLKSSFWEYLQLQLLLAKWINWKIHFDHIFSVHKNVCFVHLRAIVEFPHYWCQVLYIWFDSSACDDAAGGCGSFQIRLVSSEKFPKVSNYYHDSCCKMLHETLKRWTTFNFHSLTDSKGADTTIKSDVQ